MLKKYFEFFFRLFVHHYYKTTLKLHERIIEIPFATQKPYEIFQKYYQRMSYDIAT